MEPTVVIEVAFNNIQPLGLGTLADTRYVSRASCAFARISPQKRSILSIGCGNFFRCLPGKLLTEMNVSAIETAGLNQG